MGRSRGPNVNRLARSELVPVFAVIGICAVITITVSGVPGRPRTTRSGPRLVRVMTEWSRHFLRAARDGRLLRDLERPGSEAWRLYAAPGAPVPAQAASASYLGRVGTRHAVETLLTLCTRPDAGVARSAQRSLVQVIERNRGRWIYARIGTLVRSASLGTSGRRRLVQSLSQVGDPQSVSLLSALVCADQGVNAMIASVVARLSEGNPAALASTRGLPTGVAGLLEDGDPLVRREGTLAAGRAGDLAHVRALIGMLKDEHRGVRGNAHWALTHSLGINLPADHGSWQAWYRTESEWWVCNKERIREGLDSTLR